MRCGIKLVDKELQISEGVVFSRTWFPGTEDLSVAVILLHDSLGCVEMWRDFPLRLAESLQIPIIAYDRLGFGKSSARQGIPSAAFVSEEADIYLPQILNTLKINKYILFGHSVGGAMAVMSARRQDPSCLAVITESAQSFVEELTRDGIRKAEVDFQNPQYFAKLQRYHGDKTQWVLDAWIKVWLSVDFSSWSLENDLPLMKCPALVIHGDRDEYGSLAFPRLIAEQAGGRTELQIVENCGHVPHREQPELILKLVTAFVTKQVSALAQSLE
ncbi:MAG TPA: alpha/beta hydrolase [Pseudobdellovibrionaceae bacterium]|nr:alpha/beta hydrolase [Pseudobdellovibrionaceae bacterium]